jgi:hypothetical protein
MLAGKMIYAGSILVPKHNSTIHPENKMRVPLSEVKEVCTKSELALVTASRPPKLEKLSAAEVKKSAGLARKLFDKWQDLNRDQARDRSRKVGLGERDTRTQLKVRIFQEALQDFEARGSQAEASGKTDSKLSRSPPKKVRVVKHRETRASVRAELAEKHAALNAKAPAGKKGAGSAKPAAKVPATAAAAKPEATKPAESKRSVAGARRAAATVAKKKPKRTPPPTAAEAQSKLSASPADQLNAATAAKQTRIARSGITSRVRGHVSARGRRAQGRRDSR